MKNLENKTKILVNKKIAEKYYKMVLESQAVAKSALPGQFLMVKVCDGVQPLLRRPLSIHNVNGKSIELIYEVVGEGTRILSQCEPGKRISIIGPLGSQFNCGAKKSVILVAGGMGVAPLVFLAKQLKKNRFNKLVLIGGRSRNQILCEKEFKNMGFKVLIATDDGSKGFKGRVTELLNKELLTLGRRFSINRKSLNIYACGPKPMLKELQRIAGEKNLKAEVSLESHMACGIGACLGCVINTKQGFKRVCKEGPVFEAGEIVL